MTHNLDKYFDVVLKITKEAGKIVRQKIWEVKNVQTKSSAVDFVTETDQQVEKILISNISSNFPDHKFIGEESTAEGVKITLTDSPTWIIDPIDGTMNFVHGYPNICISIGLLVNKVTEIGIVYNPVLEQLFTARRGQGAFYNDRLMKVSGKKEISESLLAVEFGSSRDPEKMNIIEENMKILYPMAHGIRSTGAASVNLSMVALGGFDAYFEQGIRCWDMAGGEIIVREAGGVVIDPTGSAALNMAHVALGGIDGYFEFGIHAWDMAAGDIIVREAGGAVIDPTGAPFDLMSGKVLCASSKELAEQLSATIRQYTPPRDI